TPAQNESWPLCLDTRSARVGRVARTTHRISTTTCQQTLPWRRVPPLAFSFVRGQRASADDNISIGDQRRVFESESRGRGPLVLLVDSACPTDRSPGATLSRAGRIFQFC